MVQALSHGCSDNDRDMDAVSVAGIMTPAVVYMLSYARRH